MHVIVMLTREIEGSTIKCGKYWEEGTYGPLRLRLLPTPQPLEARNNEPFSYRN